MTEKDYNPEQKNAKAMKQQEKASEAKKTNMPVEKKVNEGTDKKEKPVENKNKDKKDAKKNIKGTEKPKEKKSEAVVNSKNVPVSTKYAVAICKFLKKKTIDKALEDLEKVQKLKKAVPMKGEIPHRKGKIMSGKFPIRASKHFVTILKSLKGNALVNEIEEPIIAKAIANKAQRPFGRFGRIRRKRTHITLVAESSIKNLNKNDSALKNSGIKKEVKSA